jgi:hypothetical protein
MKEYIVESANYAKTNRKQYELFNRIIIFIENPLPNNVSVPNVLAKIKDSIPKHILSDLETVYIGNFKPLIDREVDSLYVQGSIMISNDHESDKALFNTFIHEFAHAAEELYKDAIYSDGDLSREFLAKRNSLYNMLKDDYPVSKPQFLSINYSEDFDKFIYKTIGYDNIGVMTSNLFISPYGCTSLREYFANCFEHYFIEGPNVVAKLSPVAYKKIKQLLSKRSI